MRALSLLVPLLCLAACGSYQAGSFSSPSGEFPSSRLTRGCLDLAVEAYRDEAAEGPVLALHMGNRCSRAIWVDAGGLAFWVHGDDLAPVPAAIFDPRGELRPAVLEAHAQASERFELLASLDVQQICVSFERFSRRGSPGPEQRLCAPVEPAKPAEDRA